MSYGHYIVSESISLTLYSGYDFFTDHSYYAVSEGGWTALLLAAEKGHASVVARLAYGVARVVCWYVVGSDTALPSCAERTG